MRRFLAVLLLMVCARPATAQDAPDPLRIWASAGVVTGGAKHIPGGIGLMGHVAAQKSPHYAAIRFAGMSDFSGFPDSGGGDGAGEIALIYGRTRTKPWGYAAIATGLSVVAFDGCPNRYPESCVTPGLPIVAEAALSVKVIGLGVQAFGNVNPKAPYAGLALFLQLGWMP